VCKELTANHQANKCVNHVANQRSPDTDLDAPCYDALERIFSIEGRADLPPPEMIGLPADIEASSTVPYPGMFSKFEYQGCKCKSVDYFLLHLSVLCTSGEALDLAGAYSLGLWLSR